MRATLLTSVLIAIFAIACDDAAPTSLPATPAPTPGVGERLNAAATVAATRAGEPRFNGEMLGLYIAPSIDDWPAAIREEGDQRVAGGCTASASARSEFGFMQPLNPPPGFTLPSPGYDPAGQGVACSGRSTGVTFEYHRANPDSTPATVTIARGVTRAFDFDAPSSDVNAMTVGARQAVLLASLVPDAPAQRAMLIFPEDFGSTAIYAFGLRLQDLLALGEAVAAASAPYWERLPDIHGEDIAVRVCSEIPADAISHQAAFGFTEGELTSEATHYFFTPAPPPIGKSYVLRLYPGDSLDGCEGVVGDSLAFGSDPALFDAARDWLAAEGGELAGECATRPLILGNDRALADWCYYRPRAVADTIVLTVERGHGDGFKIPLTMRHTADGRYEIIEDQARTRANSACTTFATTIPTVGPASKVQCHTACARRFSPSASTPAIPAQPRRSSTSSSRSPLTSPSLRTSIATPSTCPSCRPKTRGTSRSAATAASTWRRSTLTAG